MFKYILLTLATVITLHAAANIEIKKIDGSNIVLSSTIADKAWIGIYRVGTTND